MEVGCSREIKGRQLKHMAGLLAHRVLITAWYTSYCVMQYHMKHQCIIYNQRWLWSDAINVPVWTAIPLYTMQLAGEQYQYVPWGILNFKNEYRAHQNRIWIRIFFGIFSFLYSVNIPSFYYVSVMSSIFLCVNDIDYLEIGIAVVVIIVSRVVIFS